MQAQQLGVCVGRRPFSLALSSYNNNHITRSPSFLLRAAPPALQVYNTHFRPRLHFLKHVSAALQESVTEGIAGTGLVKVKIALQRRCEFGQQFNVVGDDELFGAWNPEAAIPMQWSEGHIWTTELEVLVGKHVEYKVILVGDEGVLEWQPGPNRVLDTMESLSSLVVLETWSGEDQNDAFLGYGLETTELQDTENFSELAPSEGISPDSVMNLAGAAEFPIPVVESEGVCESNEKTVDGVPSEGVCESNEKTVDGVPSEQIIQVPEKQTMSLASEGSKTELAREPSVLEKDLQWGREALSWLWGTFVQKGNKEV